MMKKFIIILLSSVICLSAAAQGRIDRVIADLEGKNDVETTYSERRTAKKHKLYRITTVLNFKRDDYYRRLAKAFEEERDKAVSAIKTRDSHTYKFIDDKGTSTYTLTRNTVVKSWRSADDKDGDESSVNVTTDPWGDTYVTLVDRCSDKEICKTVKCEMSKAKREIARQQAAAKKEFARQQREFARQQRELAKQQREFARQQREMAARRQAAAQREHERQKRDLARF